jgi:exonuclease III
MTSLKRSPGPSTLSGSIKRAKVTTATPDDLLHAVSKKPRIEPSQQNLLIYSWNVDGLEPYLRTATSTNASTKPISSYFSHSTSSTSSQPRGAPGSLVLPQAKNPPTLREILEHHDWPDVFCMQEVKLRESDRNLMRLALDAANPSHGGSASTSESSQEGVEQTDADAGPRYDLHYTLPHPSDRIVRNRKIYGVATYLKSTLSPLVTSSRGVDWDTEGRVHVLSLADKLAIVNVYALNGTYRPHLDSSGRTRGTRHERKREFMRLLAGEVESLRSSGQKVIVLGDLNISRTHVDCYPRLRTQPPHVLARRELNEEWIPRLDVVDVVREWYGKRAKVYTWFVRGKTLGTDAARVDLMFVGRKFWDEGRVLDVGVKMERESMWRSDHCPMWAVVSFDRGANEET